MTKPGHLNCWFNPILQTDTPVFGDLGIYVKRKYRDFEIDNSISLKMLRAFARELDSSFLPEELSKDYPWTENSAWERLALNRNYVKVSGLEIVANDAKWIWLTLKPMALEGEIGYRLHITVSPNENQVASKDLSEDEIKNVLRDGYKSLQSLIFL
jgi:hypothetical protein